MSHEHENPFLTRIIHETQFIENDIFGIVSDIEPIVSGHYLFFAKKWIPSIADCDYGAASEFLENDFSCKIEKPYAYFERGRASFCTSMNGVLHGHGHLVPTFKDNMENLFSFGKVEIYNSFQDAYAACCTQGQYLLWGNLNAQFFLIQNVEEMPKRAIRNTIRKYCY